MLKPALLVAVVLCACAPPPDLVSRNGVEYHLDGEAWTQADVDAVEAQALPLYVRLMETAEGDVRHTMPGLIVQLLPPDYIWDVCDRQTHFGCADVWNGVLYLRHGSACPQESFLAHEMTHWWEYVLHRRIDYHEDVQLHGYREPFRSMEDLPRSCE